jgi:hypothetical protein
MSSPLPDQPSTAEPSTAEPSTAEPVTVVPAALGALATELGTLAAELADDGEHSRSLATTFPVALGGEEGWAAGATATAWAALEEVLADRTRAVAGTLSGAATAYRAEDQALSGYLGRGGVADGRVPR